jgi:hypothetical protein
MMFRNPIKIFLKNMTTEVLEEMFKTAPEKKLEFKKLILKDKKSEEEKFFYLALTHEHTLELDMVFRTIHETYLDAHIKFLDFADMYSFIKKADLRTLLEVSKVPDDIVGFKDFTLSIWYDYAGDKKLHMYRFVDVMNNKVLNLEGLLRIKESLVKMLEKYPELTI